MVAAAFALALALAADAFAVSLSQGAASRGRVHAQAWTLGAAFGAAQAIMPLLGWGVAAALIGVIAAFDHWVAFVVLAVLGGKLIFDGFKPASVEPSERASGWAIGALALATSIDAAAAGLTFETLRLDPFFAAGVIGIVTALTCAGGVYLGRAIGVRLGPAATIIGGVALIAIGVKTLIDHNAFG